mgnify:FL=1
MRKSDKLSKSSGAETRKHEKIIEEIYGKPNLMKKPVNEILTKQSIIKFVNEALKIEKEFLALLGACPTFNGKIGRFSITVFNEFRQDSIYDNIRIKSLKATDQLREMEKVLIAYEEHLFEIDRFCEKFIKEDFDLERVMESIRKLMIKYDELLKSMLNTYSFEERYGTLD